MHKNFAKVHFQEKNVIYLPECHSTNAHLLTLARQKRLAEGTVVFTDYQTSGRGQRGNTWESARGDNLLCSIYLNPHFLPIEQQFYLTLIASLAVVGFVRDLVGIAKVKWPNDIMVGSRKLCGILTEVSVMQGKMEEVAIGVGLNVNQSAFETDRATSLQLETGGPLDRMHALRSILARLGSLYEQLRHGELALIMRQYHEHLMWLDEEHQFQHAEEVFHGKIKGISENGQLEIEVEDKLRQFGIKEIAFLH